MEKKGDQFDSFCQPSMEKFQYFTDQDKKEENDLVSNGCVDFRGRIASKRSTGGWKASPFIIVNEIAERLAFFAIGVNMVTYLVVEMKKSLPIAVTIVTNWIGAAYVLTILGAFLADAYFGRFKTILIFSCIYAVGMALLTVSSSIDSLRPPPCKVKPCTEATYGQSFFLYSALSLIALGTGGIKPCVSSFGADQFDESDDKEVVKKYAFFNWFFFAINMGALLAITVLVYVQDQFGWELGFGIPAGTIVLSIIILVAGFPFYRFQKPLGSPFTRFLQVLLVALNNHFRGVEVDSEDQLYEVKTVDSDIAGAKKLTHTPQYRFLDKAAVITNQTKIGGKIAKNRWRLCTVTQVEEAKSLVRVIPVWASTIALSITFAQFSTFFLSQASVMDRSIGRTGLTIPTGSVPVFGAINAIILVPIYEKIAVPILRSRTGHSRGITSLQRIGVGLFVSIAATASAAAIENHRRRFAGDSPPISVFWLFPQFFLVGSAEVFAYVGQLEFFYDEATEGTRSISSALFLSEIGIGSWLSTALVKIVGIFTGGEETGWLRNDLNRSRLDYFYWVLTLINLVNFVVYVVVAWRYKGRGDKESGFVRDEPIYDVDDDPTENNNPSGRVKTRSSGNLTMIEL